MKLDKQALDYVIAVVTGSGFACVETSVKEIGGEVTIVLTLVQQHKSQPEEKSWAQVARAGVTEKEAKEVNVRYLDARDGVTEKEAAEIADRGKVTVRLLDGSEI